MNYHDITMIGKLILQKLTNAPSWLSSEKGRMLFSTSDGKFKGAGDSTYEEFYTDKNFINGMAEITSLENDDEFGLYDDSNSDNRKVSFSNMKSEFFGTAFRGHIAGLILSNGTDSDHDIDISSGVCRDSNNEYFMELTSSMTKRLDASWSAGTNQGGLFSGSIASSKWYHVFVIYNPSTDTVDAGFDTSITAANKPAGYTKYRRIGSILTNGSSNIYQFDQQNDRFFFKSKVKDIDGSTSSSSISTQTDEISVPNNLEIDAIIQIYHRYNNTDNQGDADVEFKIWSPLCDDEGQYNIRNGFAGTFNSTSGVSTRNYSVLTVRTNTSSQIKWNMTRFSSNTQIVYSFWTIGWEDDRGKND